MPEEKPAEDEGGAGRQVVPADVALHAGQSGEVQRPDVRRERPVPGGRSERRGEVVASRSLTIPAPPPRPAMPAPEGDAASGPGDSRRVGVRAAAVARQAADRRSDDAADATAQLAAAATQPAARRRPRRATC